MKIGLRSHDGSEDRLLFTQQIGAEGASIWAAAYPEYRQRCYLTVDEVSQKRERFEKYDLELTGIGLGAECIKNQQFATQIAIEKRLLYCYTNWTEKAYHFSLLIFVCQGSSERS
jgi:hypothetical protein